MQPETMWLGHNQLSPAVVTMYFICSLQTSSKPAGQLASAMLVFTGADAARAMKPDDRSNPEESLRCHFIQTENAYHDTALWQALYVPVSRTGSSARWSRNDPPCSDVAALNAPHGIAVLVNSFHIDENIVPCNSSDQARARCY